MCVRFAFFFSLARVFVLFVDELDLRWRREATRRFLFLTKRASLDKKPNDLRGGESKTAKKRELTATCTALEITFERWFLGFCCLPPAP